MGDKIRGFAAARNRYARAADRCGELLDVHRLSVTPQHLNDCLGKTRFLNVSGGVWRFGDDWSRRPTARCIAVFASYPNQLGDQLDLALSPAQFLGY